MNAWRAATGKICREKWARLEWEFKLQWILRASSSSENYKRLPEVSWIALLPNKKSKRWTAQTIIMKKEISRWRKGRRGLWTSRVWLNLWTRSSFLSSSSTIKSHSPTTQWRKQQLGGPEADWLKCFINTMRKSFFIFIARRSLKPKKGKGNFLRACWANSQ